MAKALVALLVSRYLNQEWTDFVVEQQVEQVGGVEILLAVEWQAVEILFAEERRAVEILLAEEWQAVGLDDAEGNDGVEIVVVEERQVVVLDVAEGIDGLEIEFVEEWQTEWQHGIAILFVEE